MLPAAAGLVGECVSRAARAGLIVQSSVDEIRRAPVCEMRDHLSLRPEHARIHRQGARRGVGRGGNNEAVVESRDIDAGGGIGGGLYRVGGGVSAPRTLYAPDPEYSEEARRAKFQGSVLLALIVGPDGNPRDLHIMRSLGLGLDEKALDAVRTWRFEPARKDGVPVAVQISVEVNFRLY